jgi:hypothetical protein
MHTGGSKHIVIGGGVALNSFVAPKAKGQSRLFYVKVMNLLEMISTGSSLFILATSQNPITTTKHS